VGLSSTISLRGDRILARRRVQEHGPEGARRGPDGRARNRRRRHSPAKRAVSLRGSPSASGLSPVAVPRDGRAGPPPRRNLREVQSRVASLQIE